jgi:hypothetical protein
MLPINLGEPCGRRNIALGSTKRFSDVFGFEPMQNLFAALAESLAPENSFRRCSGASRFIRRSLTIDSVERAHDLRDRSAGNGLTPRDFSPGSHLARFQFELPPDCTVKSSEPAKPVAVLLAFARRL